MESLQTYVSRTGTDKFYRFTTNLIFQVANCYYGVQNYWGALARQFWHGYYDPEVCFLSM